MLVLPAGRSCHLEAGYMVGQGKDVYVLLDNEDDRWDVMYQFCTNVYDDLYILKDVLERLMDYD